MVFHVKLIWFTFCTKQFPGLVIKEMECKERLFKNETKEKRKIAQIVNVKLNKDCWSMYTHM